jgi:hypothetical protein
MSHARPSLRENDRTGSERALRMPFAERRDSMSLHPQLVRAITDSVLTVDE